MANYGTCVWTREETNSCYYLTECENGQSFEESDLQGNYYNYCPYCGGRIVETTDA